MKHTKVLRTLFANCKIRYRRFLVCFLFLISGSQIVLWLQCKIRVGWETGNTIYFFNT